MNRPPQRVGLRRSAPPFVLVDVPIATAPKSTERADRGARSGGTRGDERPQRVRSPEIDSVPILHDSRFTPLLEKLNSAVPPSRAEDICSRMRLATSSARGSRDAHAGHGRKGGCRTKRAAPSNRSNGRSRREKARRCRVYSRQPDRALALTGRRFPWERRRAKRGDVISGDFCPDAGGPRERPRERADRSPTASRFRARVSRRRRPPRRRPLRRR